MKQERLTATRFSVWCYRLLLIAYPAQFRRSYGPHMLQVFRDGCRDVEQRRGAWGVCRIWLPTLWDLIVTVWSERIAEGVGMSTQQLQRLGSIAALIYGSLIIISTDLRFDFPVGSVSDPKIQIPRITLFFVLPIGATLALQARLRPDLGRLGRIVGAAVLLTLSVSNLSYLVFYLQLALRAPATYTLSNVGGLSELIYWISALLYGLLALKSRLGPIPNVLPLLTYGAFVFGVLGEQLSPFGVASPLLWGIGWIAIGIFLRQSHRQPEQQSSPAYSPQA